MLIVSTSLLSSRTVPDSRNRQPRFFFWDQRASLLVNPPRRSCGFEDVFAAVTLLSPDRRDVCQMNGLLTFLVLKS